MSYHILNILNMLNKISCGCFCCYYYYSEALTKQQINYYTSIKKLWLGLPWWHSG